MSQTIRRFNLAEQLRGSYVAILERSMDGCDAHWRGGPAGAVGFPWLLRYIGRRPALTGNQGLRTYEASYWPKMTTYRESGTAKQLTYVSYDGVAFCVHVLQDKATGRWDVFKCYGDRLISHVSGRNYAEAMILASGVGLHPEEPATTLEGTTEEARKENEAQWQAARGQESPFSEARKRKPARPSVEELYPRPGKLVFGVIDRGCGNMNLVFMPQKEAERLRAVHEALESGTWGEFRRRMPPADYEKVLEKLADDYQWHSFDEFYLAQADSRDREELWEEYTSLPVRDRPPLDDDGFNPETIPGLSDGDWPDWAEQLALRWLPEDVIERFGKVEDSVLNGFFLIFNPANAPAIIAALEAQGYQCAWDEELVARACGYSPPTGEGEE